MSAEGEQQTCQAAARLARLSDLEGMEPFDLVVSSDLLRARRTAILLAEALDLAAPITVEPDLREYDVGEWSGYTAEEIDARWPGDIAQFRHGDLTPPGAETRPQFDARIIHAGQRVAGTAAAGGFAGLLVVAHGGVVRSLARSVGLAEYRVGHLAGYWGRRTGDRLCPEERVNLLDADIMPVDDETAIDPAV